MLPSKFFSKYDEFTVRHLEFTSEKSFDDLAAGIDAVTGYLPEGVLAAEMVISGNVQDFERRIRSYEGRSGFVRFLTLDYGGLLEFFGNHTKARVYIIGNPLWALTTLWHEPGSALSITIRLLIYETDAGDVKLAYEIPSSLINHLRNPALKSLAVNLDAKLAALAEWVTRTSA